MFLLQLKTVIWKNWTIRKRHWFLTIIELVLPILLFLLIAYGRSKITGLNKVHVTEVTYNPPQVLQYSDLDVSETKLYFTPNTEFYQDLMRRVQIKFQMYNNNVKGFTSSESLLQYYTLHHTDTTIAIIFNEKEQENLDYVMRVHQNYYSTEINTAERYKNSFNFEPGTGTPYYYKGYLSMQKALDISFIEKVSGKDLESNVTIMIQEFPYPPHKQDSALTTMFLIYLPVITLFSFIFISPAVLKRVVEEKHSGIKELLKMVGMKSWMIWFGWFIYGMMPMVLSILCIVMLMKIPFFGTEYPPIENTDGSILFVFLLLYCMTATIFCFAISSLFRKPMVAVVAGVLVWILSYFVPKYGLDLNEMDTKLSWNLNMALNLLPNMALHYGYVAISDNEQRDVGLQWNNFYKSSSGSSDDITMLNVFVMLILDMFVYMAFTFYMDGVNPGKYGIRKSFLYPIHALLGWIKTVRAVEDNPAIKPLNWKQVEEGKGLEKGIEIRGLVKRYGNDQVVNDLFLDIYQNQITVLLGPNGAGKSTTMSIITGMLEMTSGSIKMNGKDIKDNMDEIRKSLGLCPQHNLLFTDLTVGEHLMFFAKLKGRTAKEIDEEMPELLDKLKLFEKKDAMACTLSGGMKRKLCLGMAIIGGSEVLILDEPSSGMDPESRRELWDLLLNWRRKKTILITTHFMEEADALGDWIAIMANGSLQCYGTPMGLRKKYKTGYHLSLMIRDDVTEEDKNKIEDYIKGSINTAQVKDCNGNNMVVMLPLGDNSRIARLLTNIEDNKKLLKIQNISITVTTLEDIFLKMNTDSEEDSHDAIDKLNPEGIAALMDYADKISTASSDQKEQFWVKFWALPLKKLKFYRKKIWNYLMPVFIAIIFLELTIYLSGNVIGNHGDNGPEVKFHLGLYRHTTVFYHGTQQSSLVERLKNVFQSVVETNQGRPVDVEDVQQEIVNEGTENIVYYKAHLVASAEFDAEEYFQATALYNPIAIHSAPISLNLITNSLAKTYLGGSHSITASNWPLKTINSNTAHEYSKDKVRLLWTVIMPIGFLLVMGSFIIFPYSELSTNFTQLQFMCGVKPYWYWLVNFLTDFLFYLIIAILIAIISLLSTPYITVSELFHLFGIFALYGMANVPFVYFFSRWKSASAGFAAFVITGIFFGIICPVIVQGLTELGDDYFSAVGHPLKVVCILFLPQVGLTHSVMLLIGKAIENYNWDVMPRMKHITICMQQLNPCCEGKTNECVAYQSYGPLLKENVLLMCGSCLIYLIVILLDWYSIKKKFAKLLYKIMNRQRENKVIAEKDNESLQAINLQKSYWTKQIVKKINFTLKKNECLGILGVNGAGKTTTFRMLAREEAMFDGEVQINNCVKNEKGEFITTTTTTIDQDEYVKNLGYCPQRDALNFILTGKEILTLIAQLRGITDMQIVDDFLKLFELKEYADRPCGHYSGGNKRKLSLAIALIGFQKYILLDEPTNGVDPSSRRKFWTLIKRFKEKKGKSFILTSHSMMECEALCNDLKIMKDGQFEEEDTISELKKKHNGFNIKLKLFRNDLKTKEDLLNTGNNHNEESYDEVDSMGVIFNDVEELKAYFAREHNGTVKDEHASVLHVYVEKKNFNWSRMFNELENIKNNNRYLIEDYTISEASLEDVFLAVARSGKPEKGRK